MRKPILWSVLTAGLFLGGIAGEAAAGPFTAESSGRPGAALLGEVPSPDSEAQPAATGIVDPFANTQRVPATLDEYSLSARPFDFDERPVVRSPVELLLEDVGVFTIDGVKHRELLADNQGSEHRDEFVSLDKLLLFESATDSRTGSPLGTLVWDLDPGGTDQWERLDYSLKHGGAGDMAVYIPDALYSGENYLYLYSRFVNYDLVTGEIDEWWTTPVRGPNVPVPEPATLLLLATGVGAILRRRASILRRRTRR
jgi:hypothetical protein